MTEFFGQLLSRRRFLANTAMTAGATLGGSALLEACGSGGSTTASAGTVELTFILPGTPPANWDAVLAAMNQKLAKDGMNLSFKAEFISWATFIDQTLLKMTAGDNFDALLTAPWAHLDQFITEGDLVALDSYVAQAPNLKATIPQAIWNANKFNGKIMAIPMGSSLASIDGFVIRKDLRLKYGMPQITTFAQLEAYLYKVKASEKNMVPYSYQKEGAQNFSQWFNDYYWENQPGDFTALPTAFVNITHEGQIVPWWAYTGYLQGVQRARKYLQDGIFTQDMTSLSGADSNSLFKAGKTAVAMTVTDGTTTNTFGDVLKNVPGSQMEVVYPFTQPNPKPLNGFVLWNFVAVNKRSQHADKVIKLLDWLSMKENHDLVEYGIQGKDWQPVGSDAYTAISEYPAQFPGFALTWRPSLERTPSNMLPDEKQWYEWASKTDSFTYEPLAQFVFDPTPVKTQIAQLNAASTQYRVPLESGLLDPTQGLAQLQKAFGAAGYDQVIAEAQKQLDAFRKAL
jgi:putative aldouronate transport system substrate-binding protein